ncbi:MAG: hypothetical protein KDB68_11600 [Planctomycetes bacterium]|nr:hypothetical protein [Planctomycetota bacterium]
MSDVIGAIAGGLSALGKVPRLVSGYKKDVAHADLAVAQSEEIRTKLTERQDEEAWKHAETIASYQHAKALEVLTDLAQKMGQFHVGLSLWRWRRLGSVKSEAVQSKTDKGEEDVGLETADEAINSAYFRMIDAVSFAVFFLADAHIEYCERYIQVTGQLLSAILQPGATMESTDEPFKLCVEAFRTTRTAIRWRIDPIETLRERELLLKLERRGKQNFKKSAKKSPKKTAPVKENSVKPEG